MPSPTLLKWKHW